MPAPMSRFDVLAVRASAQQLDREAGDLPDSLYLRATDRLLVGTCRPRQSGKKLKLAVTPWRALTPAVRRTVDGTLTA